MFEDHDRDRAHKRLDAIDNLGAERLFDALWPDEKDKVRANKRLRSEDRRLVPRRSCRGIHKRSE